MHITFTVTSVIRGIGAAVVGVMLLARRRLSVSLRDVLEISQICDALSPPEESADSRGLSMATTVKVTANGWASLTLNAVLGHVWLSEAKASGSTEVKYTVCLSTRLLSNALRYRLTL